MVVMVVTMAAADDQKQMSRTAAHRPDVPQHRAWGPPAGVGVGGGLATPVEVSSILATPVEGRSTGKAAVPAEDLSFDHPALDTGAGVLRLTGEASKNAADDEKGPMPSTRALNSMRA